MPCGLQLYLKETPTQMLSRRYWGISLKTYFEVHLCTPASEETLGSN